MTGISLNIRPTGGFREPSLRSAAPVLTKLSTIFPHSTERVLSRTPLIIRTVDQFPKINEELGFEERHYAAVAGLLRDRKRRVARGVRRLDGLVRALLEQQPHHCLVATHACHEERRERRAEER